MSDILIGLCWGWFIGLLVGLWIGEKSVRDEFKRARDADAIRSLGVFDRELKLGQIRQSVICYYCGHGEHDLCLWPGACTCETCQIEREKVPA